MGTTISRTRQKTVRQDAVAVRGNPRKAVGRALPFLALTLISLVVLYPFVFVLLTSLKTSNEVRIDPLGLPRHWLWRNYREAWTGGHFGTYFRNSVFVAVPVVVAVVVSATLAAFAFSQFRFRGSRVLFWYFLAGLGLPLEAIIISLYFQMLDLDLLNTRWSVILPMTGLILPFGVLILTGFIGEIPREMLDAAKLDGASDGQLLRQIVVPLAWPGIVTVIVFAFLWTWNQFFLPAVMLTDADARTLPIGLYSFIGAYTSEQHLLAAGTLITALPVIVLYVVFQRQFVQGITVGSLK
jgi:raffinose/stachyose/melibiose transport system permease protein